MPSPSSYVGPGELWRLLFGAILLKPAAFEEAAREPEALRLCLASAVIGGAAYGFRLAIPGIAGPLAAAFGIVLVLGHLVIDAALVWILGRPATGRATPYGRILRPLALALAPALLYGVLALLEAPAQVDIAASLWMLIAFVIAVRAALETGWLVTIAIALLLRIANELLWHGLATL